jgi:hypothetical protein
MKCIKCHRELKTPESIQRGMGLVCANKGNYLQPELFGMERLRKTLRQLGVNDLEEKEIELIYQSLR